jgi:hypothetical protein
MASAATVGIWGEQQPERGRRVQLEAVRDEVRGIALREGVPSAAGAGHEPVMTARQPPRLRARHKLAAGAGAVKRSLPYPFTEPVRPAT